MPAASRPTAAALAGLAVDDWSALLAVALPVVRDLPERLVDATVQRVVAVPPGRLASGRSREDLARVLARREVWDLVAAKCVVTLYGHNSIVWTVLPSPATHAIWIRNF